MKYTSTLLIALLGLFAAQQVSPYKTYSNMYPNLNFALDWGCQ